MARPARPGKPKTKPVIDDSLIGTLGAYVAEGGRASNNGRESMGGKHPVVGKIRGRGRPLRSRR